MTIKYGLIGLGNRARMYIHAIAEDYSQDAALVAVADTNPGRIDFYDRYLQSQGLPLPDRYDPNDIKSMVQKAQLDRVIVTTPDHTHGDVVSQVLLAGADAIVEKPLATNVAEINQMIAAEQESGRRITTTFNYRYSPRNSALKSVIQSGEIGEVTSVHFEWALDTMHGADYFRRWHREKNLSGGLLVHKASHHFDLVNWWIDASPQWVMASGGLYFYGQENAEKRGLGPRPRRGSESSNDPFSLDLRKDDRLKQLYLDVEHHDGYIRDRDVFDPGIDIEDNMGLLVQYSNGVPLTYSLNAHAPWEGYRVTVNGTKGRAELEVVERGAILLDDEGQAVLDPSVVESFDVDGERKHGQRLLVQKHWQKAQKVEIAMGVGSHGGGDAILLSHLFESVHEDKPLGRIAGLGAGIAAAAVGIAGNESLVSGQVVHLDSLGLASYAE